MSTVKAENPTCLHAEGGILNRSINHSVLDLWPDVTLFYVFRKAQIVLHAFRSLLIPNSQAMFYWDSTQAVALSWSRPIDYPSQYSWLGLCICCCHLTIMIGARWSLGNCALCLRELWHWGCGKRSCGWSDKSCSQGKWFQCMSTTILKSASLPWGSVSRPNPVFAPPSFQCSNLIRIAFLNKSWKKLKSQMLRGPHINLSSSVLLSFTSCLLHRSESCIWLAVAC